ncbi:MAG: hypothetical protein EB078_05575 [Proteobacteria bacterium]|nr:hypothetical protein [Pseudomonadota bacterium]NDC24331.1 hypothetical protein [Pseudomonadota bacterium]NDD04354.1 hypothetical protein [Pseudomonadota bacterium]NDG26749.1 hypothetical protein [Pseudomonadota bacterium]
MKHLSLLQSVILMVAPLAVLLQGCGSTQVIESPKTAYVAETGAAKTPAVIWTSRAFGQPYEYLGRVEARSLTYDGAMERLIEGGKQLRADALIDVHFEQIGFLSDLQAFAIKYK